jgi:pimeloyl-ACP methyl ester carboxylesterase
MANIILVAGTFHGGWYWDPIIPMLENQGHVVCAPTLEGLSPEAVNVSPVNLDTHIQNVLDLIAANDFDDVVLVGWSYAGMVITGVADKTAAAVRKVIYLDAQLPNSGQREWDLMPEADRESMLNMCLDGIKIYPDAWLREYESRVNPHPIGTKLQPIYYDQSKFDALDKVFIYAEKWFHNPAVVSPLRHSFLSASGALGWRVESWPFGHDLIREASQEVAKLLILECAE